MSPRYLYKHTLNSNATDQSALNKFWQVAFREQFCFFSCRGGQSIVEVFSKHPLTYFCMGFRKVSLTVSVLVVESIVPTYSLKSVDIHCKNKRVTSTDRVTTVAASILNNVRRSRSITLLTTVRDSA